MVLVKKKTDALDKDDNKANAGTAKNLDDKLTAVLKADVEPRKQYDLDYTAMINALGDTKSTYKAWLDLDKDVSNKYWNKSYKDEGAATSCDAAGTALVCVDHKDEAVAANC